MPSHSHLACRALVNLAEQIASHRSYLLRLAHLQLRVEAWAEDVVSETLLAALAQAHGFKHQSQLRTWLVGILKNKIVDELRRRSSEVFARDEDQAESDIDPLDEMPFNAKGEHMQPPAAWGDPEASLRSKQFMDVFELCTRALPAQQARAFLMREWLELSVEEICKEIEVRPTHLYVLLHRARLRLRECLEIHWFGQKHSS